MGQELKPGSEPGALRPDHSCARSLTWRARAGRQVAIRPRLRASASPKSPPPAAPSPRRLLSLRSRSRSPAPSRSPGRGIPRRVARRRPRRRPSATMAHRGPPRFPKSPSPAARAPSRGAPPLLRWPRSRPFLLLLLLLAACGAAGRSPEPRRLGPRAQLTRVPPSPPAGRTEHSGREDRQTRGAEPGALGPDPSPAPGPGEPGAPALGKGRWARAAPVAGVASRAQVSLISTSFVLKGDATHNQAMVHWTGENSSVSGLARSPSPRPLPGTPGEIVTAAHFRTTPQSSPAFSDTWGRGHLGGAPAGLWSLATWGKVSRFLSLCLSGAFLCSGPEPPPGLQPGLYILGYQGGS